MDTVVCGSFTWVHIRRAPSHRAGSRRCGSGRYWWFRLAPVHEHTFQDW
ncbi:hypothetical protein ID866_10078 [Astraeus odoratus]|nr:hypothetical protein ID866_10078 [Astraeus odoratus]